MLPCEKFGTVRAGQMQSLIREATGVCCGPTTGVCPLLTGGIAPDPREQPAIELIA